MIKVDDEELGSRDNIEGEEDEEVTVQCEVKGGKPKPEMRLFYGTKEVLIEDEDDCKASGRSSE